MKLPAARRDSLRSFTPSGRTASRAAGRAAGRFALADSGGGGVRCRSAQRALLALALLAIACAAAAALHSNAAAQTTNPIEFEFVTTKAATARLTLIGQEYISRPSDFDITGKVTLEIKTEVFTRRVGINGGLRLSHLTATNATLSNFRNVRWWQTSTVDVTPTASGPVTVNIQAGVLEGYYSRDRSRRNAAGSVTLNYQPGAPELRWADFSSRYARWGDLGGPHAAGSFIDLTVTFSEHVTVVGLPTVSIRPAGGALVNAVYHSGSGSSVLVFRHTVPAGGYGRAVTTIVSDSIALPPGASIKDAASPTPNDAALTLPPRYEELIALHPGSGTGLPRPGNTVGDEYDFEVLFSEPVAVSHEPGAELAYLRMVFQTKDGGTTRVRAVYVGGSGTNQLAFRYTVAAEDNVQRWTSTWTTLDLPQGASIRSVATGIELSRTRVSRFRNTAIGHAAGAQSWHLFGLRPVSRGHDVIVHFFSSDPARLSIGPAWLLFRDYALYPGDWDWQDRRRIRATLHPDSDGIANDVHIGYRLETTDPDRDGETVEEWLTLRIVADGQIGADGQIIVAPPGSLELVLSVADDSDNVVQAGDSVTIDAKLVYVDGYRELAITEPGRLNLAGGVEWESSGRRQIAIPAQALEQRLDSGGVCTRVTIDGPDTWTCELETEDSTIVVPDGAFTVRGTVEIEGITYHGSLDVTVADVDEVASATLDFATDIAPGASTDTPTRNWTGDDQPYPNQLAAGERTRLRLTVLNENETASAAGSIASILLTTTAGSLSLLSPEGDCTGGGGRSCQLPVNLLNGVNSDNIQLELAHSGEAAQAAVRATVIANDGEAFSPEPLSVTMLGTAQTLVISEPDSPILNVGTPDAFNPMEVDSRDLLTLSVTALDAAGNMVPVPAGTRRAELRGPDGEVVWSGSDGGALRNGVRVDWPVRLRWGGSSSRPEDQEDRLADVNFGVPGVQPRILLDPDGNLQAQIDVDALSTRPLTAGEYTLKLTAGRLSATQRIIVSSEPAAVSLSKPQSDGAAAPGGVITVTASVTDADGNQAPDGTPVTWAEPRLVGESPVLVQVSIDRTTTDGTASASYQVVGFGSSYLRASAGTGTDVQLFNAPAPAAPPPDPAAALTRRAPGGVSVWLGEGQTTASALLAGIPHATTIRTLRAGLWLRYGVVDGREVPGSIDFIVRPGDILWPAN